ncbi:hypothetical protein [Thiohalocapsa sp. ML1]|jgi:hypothetical protein|uniref:hypothetical protein n=1 Tax=Thiohalocapsa sp. ML1 TaxID=1431688 RepID=UPI0012E33BA1|nr:hypothetical protein [Thiohalocapsa sp. ML1]
MTEQSSKHYSDAFAKIIRDDDDLIGSLAYAIYKKEKREFIVAHNLERDDPRVVGYHHDLNGTRIEGLRIAAEAKLTDYAGVIEQNLREGVQWDEAHQLVLANTNERVEDLKDVIDRVKRDLLQNTGSILTEVKSSTAWWKSVIWSTIGGFALGLALTLANVIQWTNPLASFTSAGATDATNTSSAR